MTAIILKNPGAFQMCQFPEPGDIPPGHALVRVRRVGICGTDWHAYHGRQPFFAYPRILGHELGVEVERVNDPSSPLRPGDRCAVEPYINCGKCIACRQGKGNCCGNLQVLGVHVDGGMCEWLILPTHKLHPSSKLSLDQLALVETLGIGCHATARIAPQRDENVLILGAGPIGLSVIPFVQSAGARPIVADVSATRLAFCQKTMDVRHTFDATRDLVSQLQAVLHGDLPTAVIDATGNARSMGRCFDLIANGGRICFVGLFQGDLSFNDPNFHRREITLLASRNALPDDFTRIIQLIEQRKMDIDSWITHKASAHDFLEALPQWLLPNANVLKAIVEF